MEQLSPCTATTEPVLHDKRSHHDEKPEDHSWRGAPDGHNERKPLSDKEDPAQP